MSRPDDDPVRVRAQLDQAMALLGDTLPPALKSFYDKNVEAGFTKEEAMELTKAMLARFLGGAL